MVVYFTTAIFIWLIIIISIFTYYRAVHNYNAYKSDVFWQVMRFTFLASLIWPISFIALIIVGTGTLLEKREKNGN